MYIFKQKLVDNYICFRN